MSNVESDLREKWRAGAFDRTAWASVVKEAKVKHKGLQC